MIAWKSDEYETVFFNFGMKSKRPLLRSHLANRNVFKDLPESGGGGASTGKTSGADVVATDDDDDGGDNDPDPDRPGPRKKTKPSFYPALFTFAFLSHYVGFGRSRIYVLIQQGKFPPPIKVGKSSRWVKTEVDAWLKSHQAARGDSNVEGAANPTSIQAKNSVGARHG
jgi:predicted DNA-binding transcriptional regulator AlpA